MNFELQYKALPEEDPTPADLSGDSLDPTTEGPSWSGDVYEQGDEPDPADAYAHLKGAGGVEGWLEHRDDGTITGWVRDVDGTVYRYTDPTAWAIDVDDAGLKNVAGSTTEPAAEPAEEEPLEEEDSAGDGESVDGPDAHLDNRNKRFAFEGKDLYSVYEYDEEV